MYRAKGVRSFDIRASNRLAALRLLHKKTASRVDIATELGLSKTAVSSIVEELLEEGLVIEVGTPEAEGNYVRGKGKPPILLNLNAKAGLFLSMFCDMNSCEMAVFDFGGNMLSYHEEQIDIHPDFQETFAKVVARVRRMIDEVRANDVKQPVLACGVVLKGTINADKGIMAYTATVPEWREIPIGAFLESELDVPVFIENDARALTLFEMSEMNTSFSKPLVFVSIGSGIGTGLVMNQVIYRGDQGGAVNFAHTAIMPDGPVCSCGNRGCWEALASTEALTRELGRRDQRFNGIAGVDQVLAHYASGDAVVEDVLHNYTAYWVGIGIANILNVMNPNTMIIQSALLRAGDAFKQRIETVAKERALPFAHRTPFVFAEIQPYLHLKSAFSLVMQAFFSKEHHQTLCKHLLT